MSGLEKKYYDDVVGLYESYFRRQVCFKRESTKKIFPRDPPVQSKELLRRIFRHAEKVGYFRRRSCVI
jgi:hypothetical protein